MRVRIGPRVCLNCVGMELMVDGERARHWRIAKMVDVRIDRDVMAEKAKWTGLSGGGLGQLAAGGGYVLESEGWSYRMRRRFYSGLSGGQRRRLGR